MAVAQYTPRPVRADLGGMAVEIPQHYAEFVEYDGDPGFGEKRSGPRPERTPQSRLRGFGMDVRYPDMKGLENAEVREQKRRQRLADTPWLYVGVVTGEDYPGTGFLDRQAHATLHRRPPPELKGHWRFIYERLPGAPHGLEAYALSAIDPRTNRPARESPNTEDVFIHRNAEGRADTYIRCSNTPVPGGANCELSFALEPKARAEVNVSLRRGLLPEWQPIQEAVRRLLLGFEVRPEQGTATPATR